MSKALAGPPIWCCVTGLKHTGTFVGHVESTEGLDTYISEPPAGTSFGPHKKVILFLSDVFGPMYVNNQLLEDYFASCEFIVLGPDYLLGTHFQDLPKDSDWMAWSTGALAPAMKAFPKWFDAVKALYGTGTTKYTAVAAEGAIVAGAIAHPSFPIAHPSFLEESHFEKVSRPVLLYCSEVDWSFSLQNRRLAEDILVRNKSTYFIQVFSGVSHGFAVRGNMDVPHERWAKEESARGIKEWFTHFSA